MVLRKAKEPGDGRTPGNFGSTRRMGCRGLEGRIVEPMDAVCAETNTGRFRCDAARADCSGTVSRHGSERNGLARIPTHRLQR